MRFPNIKINRRLKKTTVIRMTPPNKTQRILIDPGYENGYIHIYKCEKKIPGKDLRGYLETEFEDCGLSEGNYIHVNDLDRTSKFTELFRYENQEK